jgi:hypothetical protein
MDASSDFISLPKAGLVYQLNKVHVEVVGFDDDEVRWQEKGKKALHRTPRWYFELHAAAPSR